MQDPTPRLKFQKCLEEHKLYLEQEIHKKIKDNTSVLIYETALVELEYIWKMFDLSFNGHICNMENLK